MSELLKVMAKLKKTFGDEIGHIGKAKPKSDRIPTGVFPLDLATGGGFPCGKVSIVYGAESSGKTTVALMAIAYVQRALGLKAVFVDLEGTLDLDWAHHCGVVTEDLVVLEPDTAEQTVDLVESVIYANDVGIVVVDSLAAMTTENEINSGAEKMIVGGASLIVGKMIRKTVSALTVERKRGHFPAVIFINQIRIKIGTMFGDPETQPGGNAVKFASSLSIRLYGKDVLDKDVHPSLPTFKAVTGTIRKNKISIASKSFEYDLCLIPHKHYQMLDSPSWKTVAGFLKQYGLLVKVGAQYECMGVKFQTLGALEEAYNTNDELRRNLQSEVIAVVMKKENQGAPSEEQPVLESGQDE